MRQPHILGDAGVTDEVRRLRDRFRYPDELGGSDDASIPVTGGGGIPTLFIAASDALQSSKDSARFQCDGTNDEVQWQAAVDALGADGGRVWGSEGTFTFSATVNLPAADTIHIEGMGWQATKITMANGTNIDLFTLNDPDTNLVIRDVQLHGNADNNAAGRGLLVSSAASVYVTHCQLREFDTAAADITAQFVNQVIDSLIQECPIGVIYRHATSRGHLTGNDFENNTTDISIVDTAGTVVVANRSVGATTFLSRTAGDVYAWANDDGGAAYAGTIISAHNSSGTGDHSDVAALSATKLIDDEGDDRVVVEINGDITTYADDGLTVKVLYDEAANELQINSELVVTDTHMAVALKGIDAGLFQSWFHDGANESLAIGHIVSSSDTAYVNSLRGQLNIRAENRDTDTGAPIVFEADDSVGTIRTRLVLNVSAIGDHAFYAADGVSITLRYDEAPRQWEFETDVSMDGGATGAPLIFTTSAGEGLIHTTAETIRLNPSSGDDAGTVIVESIEDASLVDGTGVLQVGPSGAVNVGFDQNQIQARSGSSGASLFINTEGGDLFLRTTGADSRTGIALSGDDISFRTSGGSISFLWDQSDGRWEMNTSLVIDQPSTTGALPVLTLDQADISEEMIEFVTTIGVGNAIEAIGVKTLTTTHFIKVTLPGSLTRYIPAGTIA